ncbi:MULTISPECIES: hypothetical protein [Paenibacillus]|uniref:hypothetical protein n=1 Tax=Paenibacillus TaxID=44249 RepID=UPI001915424C|nr:hypothetical protein [Paenibacillus sp. EPM92]
MNIINFLLENWIVVAIVFFVFSSLFKQMKQGNSAKPQSPGKPVSSMPPFGGGGSGWPKGSDARPMRKAAPGQPQAASAERADTRGHANKPPVIRESAERQAAAEDPYAAQRERRERPLAVGRGLGERVTGGAGAAEPASAPGPLRPEDAALGVLWAEILGPPRAKRPYRR